MTRNIKLIFALSSSVCAMLNPTLSTAKMVLPCNTAFSKDAIHCAYISSTDPKLTGKYIKVKVSKQGFPASTKIFCAAAGTFPVMSISQNSSGLYTPGTKMNWQFSQCSDEDCSANQALVDDKFTITKTGEMISSGPKDKVEVSLNPAYGDNCKASDAHIVSDDDPLSTSIEDMVSLLQYIPEERNDTISILTKMIQVATTATDSVVDQKGRIALDEEYEKYMAQIDKLQRVNTISGVKTVNGKLRLTQLSGAKWSLDIPSPLMDLDALGVRNTDVLTIDDANAALVVLNNAVSSIVALKNTQNR